MAEQLKLSLAGGVDALDRRTVLAPGFFALVLSGGVGFVRRNYELGNFKLQLSYMGLWSIRCLPYNPTKVSYKTL